MGSDWLCLDCGVDTAELGEYYMVCHRVWYYLSRSDEGMLCIGCLENRLGRCLTKKDFIKAPVNRLDVFHKSDRLIDRLTT